MDDDASHAGRGIRLVSADYFRSSRDAAAQRPLFHHADKLDAPPVVIINQALAERYWPNERSARKRMQLPTRKSRSGRRSSASSATSIIAGSINP
jgi:hypothetical protein